jgi:hypothetical protein
MQATGSTTEVGTECRQWASVLAEHIQRLSQPYQRNMISWLEKCTARPLRDLDHDLAVFFNELGTIERELYASNLQDVLDDALRYFADGAPGAHDQGRSRMNGSV